MTGRQNSEQPVSRVLIVAGSDSGGGAGLQADIKTVSALGGFAMTAVTAITAQNTLGVQQVWPVPAAAVKAQMESVLSDIGVDAIKTGMLGSAAQVETVGDVMDALAPSVPCIVDPVLFSTSGRRLTEPAAFDALMSVLLPGISLVTPNAPEAEAMTGKAVDSIDGMRRAAEALLERGAKAALVKGGHLDGDMLHDVLQTVDGEWIYEDRRIETRATHGTGCTLASAIATRAGQGLALSDCVMQARQYLRGAIAHATVLGAGTGPVNHAWAQYPRKV
ncbi:MAG: bifunctional hydroxymethylpyrimidine kinase/phosphomethylpyrimidine kinase [Henriciella sp.]